MAGKAKSKRGFGKKLKDQQVTNKELYSISGAVPTQASNSIVTSGSQGGGTYQNVQSADIYMNTYDIVDVDRLKFATKEGAGDSLGATDTGIDSLFSGSTSYGMKIQIPMDTANVFQIMRGTTEVFNANEISTIIGGGEGELIALNDNVQMGADYLQMGGMVSPTNPPVNSRRIFVDTDNSDHLTVRKSDGTEVDLEASGWAGSATSDLDMNTWDIIDVDRLQFVKDSGAGRDQTKVEMYASGNTPEDAIINHPEDSYFRFTENGQQYLTISNNSLDGIMPIVSGHMSLGSATKLWQGINTEQITVYGGGAGINGTQIGLNMATSGGQVGVHCGGTGYAFTSIWDGAEDLGRSNNYWNDLYTKEINLKEKLTIADTSANPSANGEFTRNGNDVKVYTGGGVKNLSDIGTGGSSGANTTLSNLGTTSINADLIPSSNNSKDLGSSTKQWAYLHVGVQANIDYLVMDGSINCDSNDIINVDDMLGTGTLTWSGTTMLSGSDISLGNSATDQVKLYGDLDWKTNYSTVDVATPATASGKLTIKVAGSTKYLYYYDS